MELFNRLIKPIRKTPAFLLVFFNMFIIYEIEFKYLPATLNANDGSIIKTVVTRSLCNTRFNNEPFTSGPPTKTSKIPVIPKTIDEYINTRVAIFCIISVYHNLIISMLHMDINNNYYKIRLKYSLAN